MAWVTPAIITFVQDNHEIFGVETTSTGCTRLDFGTIFNFHSFQKNTLWTTFSPKQAPKNLVPRTTWVTPAIVTLEPE